MKRFLGQIALFSIPFLIVIIYFLFFWYQGYKVGEFQTLEYAVEVQRENHDILIGYGYNEETAYYKMINANHYHADVLALGTSRVMQFRNDFFSSTFYNTGGAVGDSSFDGYINFLKNLDYRPKLILLGMDFWVFNQEWKTHYAKKYEGFESVVKEERSQVVMTKQLLEDYRSGKWNFESINNYPENYGMNATIKQDGFMFDGSYYYGSTYRRDAGADDRISDSLARIAGGNRRFEWGTEVSASSFDDLEQLLVYCKENGVHVVGFLSPVSPTVRTAMMDSGNYEYVDKLTAQCPALFDAYGYTFMDFLWDRELPFDDDYYIDGFHGGDIVYAYMLKEMNIKDQVLDAFVDDTAVECIIEKSLRSGSTGKLTSIELN